MAHWLVKSDPDEYSAADLERDRLAAWTGVRNPAAQGHLRAMKGGDAVLVYHTGSEKAIVALARVAGPPTPDPTDSSGKTVCVNLCFERWLAGAVSLATIKAEPAFREFALVRISRLSVMPVSAAHWSRLLRLAGPE